MKYPEETDLEEIDYSHELRERQDRGTGKQTLDGPAVYEFIVAQSLSDQWAAWFDGLEISYDDQGNTHLKGTLPDQAALHGVLTKIRDLHLILLSLICK